MMEGAETREYHAPVLAARPDVLAAVQGFASVEVDPRGFRSGAMNELLSEPDRYR